MWVWVLAAGGALALLFLAALAVIGLANRRWEQQQDADERHWQAPPASDPPT